MKIKEKLNFPKIKIVNNIKNITKKNIGKR